MKSDTTKPDPVLEYWKIAEVTLHAGGRDQKLTIQQLWQILHNMTAEDIENAKI